MRSRHEQLCPSLWFDPSRLHGFERHRHRTQVACRGAGKTAQAPPASGCDTSQCLPRRQRPQSSSAGYH